MTMRYSDQEFADKVCAGKIFVIKILKKAMNQAGIIRNRGNFTDEHIEVYNKYNELHDTQKYTWDEAAELAVSTFKKSVKEPSTVKDAMQNVIDALSKLDETINKLSDHATDDIYDQHPRDIGTLPELIENITNWKNAI